MTPTALVTQRGDSGRPRLGRDGQRPAPRRAHHLRGVHHRRAAEGSTRPDAIPPPPPGVPDGRRSPRRRSPPRRPVPPTLRTPRQRPTPTPPVTPRRRVQPRGPARTSPGLGSGAQRPAVTRSVTGLDAPPRAAGRSTSSGAAPRLAEKEAAAERRRHPGRPAHPVHRRWRGSRDRRAGPAAGGHPVAGGRDRRAAHHAVAPHLLRHRAELADHLRAAPARHPEEVRARVSGDLGPALDDLTDQVETDRAKLTARGRRAERARPAAHVVGEIVDGLPLTNVEILTSLQALGTDLEDRFARSPAGSATRSARSSGPSRRATRLRTQVDDLRAITAGHRRPRGDRPHGRAGRAADPAHAVVRGGRGGPRFSSASTSR